MILEFALRLRQALARRIPGRNLDPASRVMPARTTQADEPPLTELLLIRERLHQWRP